MIDELRIRNLALIEDATLRPAAGLTVLSGETGAGKTALLSAAKLLAGDRADSSQVRQGTREAVVEARFVDVPGEDAADGELVAVRRIGADGRSRCTVDGEMAAVKTLSSRVRPLLELCGQHEHQTLLEPATHVAYLDEWIGDDAREALSAYREALDAAAQAQAAYDEVARAASRSAEDLEVARFTVSEIERVDPKPGEEERLESELPALQHAEELSQGASEAIAQLKSDGGAIDALASAAAVVERLADIDRTLGNAAIQLAALADEAQDVASELRGYRDNIEFDPEGLEERLMRLSALEGLKRRYGPRMEDVFARLESAREAIEGVEDSAERLAAAKRAVDAAEDALAARARALAAVRAQGARGFCAALADAVADLQMAGARFEMRLDDLPRASWTQAGPQRIELLYAAGRGLECRPLARIASGGELSRVMLALRGTVHRSDAGQTLIFDEIDAGVGGSAAVAVGNRLAELARANQVIVVTHLAQIAVHADLQLVVSKGEGEGGLPATRLVAVEGEERVAEIARMLSGDQTEASLEHARALLGM